MAKKKNQKRTAEAKKAKRCFIVSWAVYPFDVMVCLGMTRGEVLGELNKRCDITQEEKEVLTMPGVGRTVLLEGGQTVLWMKDYPSEVDGFLVHEIFHATHFLFERIGLKLIVGADEAFAYAIGYLTDQIRAKLA